MRPCAYYGLAAYPLKTIYAYDIIYTYCNNNDDNNTTSNNNNDSHNINNTTTTNNNNICIRRPRPGSASVCLSCYDLSDHDVSLLAYLWFNSLLVSY